MDLAILAIQDIFTSNLSGDLAGIKRVFYGDPIQIPESDFPIITIMPVGSNIEFRPAQHDKKVHSIEVRIVYNQKTFFGNSATITSNKLTQLQSLIKQVENTNAQQVVNSNTIIGLLVRESTLPYNGNATASTVNNFNISYERSESRGYPTFEAVISFDVQVVANTL